MSELYDNQDMDVKMTVDQETNNIETFKNKYHALKVELYHLCNALVLFDHDCPIKSSEIMSFLTIENIMELCRICHEYFLCRNISMITSAQHILEKVVITDDSPKDEIYMYFIAYLFMIIDSEPHKHMELYDLIIDVSNYYYIYIKSNGNEERMIFEMISLEESMNNFGF
jgi:hypothetical protein